MPAEPEPRLLLEREAPWTSIGLALQAARQGQGRVLAVVGAAGLGKTTLLREARESAVGLRVLSARPGEMERHVPFGAVHQLLDPAVLTADAALREELFSGAAALSAPLFEPEMLARRFAQSGSDFSVPVPTSPGVELFPSLHGLYWLVANLSRSGPLLLLLDDAQWADRATLAFVELLARRCEDLPLALLLGTRPPDEAAHPELLQILADPGVQRLALQPLSSEAVEGLITGRLGTRPHQEFVQACWSETGGNPFLLTEVLHEVQSQGLAPSAATARSVGTLTPDGVLAAVAVRLARLTPDAAAVAEAAAVLGDDVSLLLVAEQAELDESTVRSAARSLVRSGLLSMKGGAVSFVHPLMRTTVLARMDPIGRDLAHRRAASLLLAAGRDAAGVAAHLHQTSPTGSVEAVKVLRRAAASARALGEPQSAAMHLRRALEEPPADDVLADVLIELGRAETAAGLPQAQEHLRRAVEMSEGRRRGVAVMSLAATLKFRGAAAEAVDLLQTELAGLPSEVRDLAQAEIAAARVSSVRSRQLLGTAPLELSQPWATDRGLQLRLSAFRAFDLASSGGSRDEAVQLARQALAVRPLPLDPLTSAGLATLSAGVACYWMGALSDAESAFDAMLVAARDAGSPVAVSTVSSMLALIAFRRGDVADCVDFADEALELGGGPVVPPLLAAALGARAQAAAEQEMDPDELRAWDRRLVTAQLDPDATPRAEVIHARAVLHAALGEVDAAARLFLEAGEVFVSWGAVSPVVQPWRSEAGRMLHRLGRAEQARRLVAEELSLAEASGSPAAIAVALTARASVDPVEPQQDLERAAGLWHESGAGRLDLARNRLELGRLLRRQGHQVQARAVLQAAQEQAVRSGGDRTAAAAREELIAAGARPRRVAVTGRDALTVAERRVVDLAVQGRTNRAIAQELFVSEKTVETHLGHTYAKLGIRSRTALASALLADQT